MEALNIFTVVILLGCGTTQFLFDSGPTLNENYGGYRFEYHRTHRLLLVKSKVDCYLIFTDDVIETAIKNGGFKGKLETEIMAQITSGKGVSNTTISDIKYDFHDYLAAAQCNNHAIYKLDYKLVMPTSTPQTLPTDSSVVTQTQTTVTNVVGGPATTVSHTPTINQ